MISAVAICIIALISVSAGFAIAFSPSRSVLIVSSVTLSVGLSLLGVFALDMRSVFWIAPSYLLLDIIMLYFIFSTGLQSGGPQQILPWKKIRLTGIVLLILGVFAMAAWEVWRFSADVLPTEEKIAAPIHQMLWEANMPIVILCLLLLAPVSIGALLMVRLRD